MTTPTDTISIVTTCHDLDAAIGFYTGQLEFRLDMVMPADAPRIAELSGHGLTIQLERVGLAQAGPMPHQLPPAMEADMDAVHVVHADTGTDWIPGRAGMHYRDLLPGRVGGQVIASRIRIVDGGPVADYVHYHHVGFQVIFCRRGWVRVVYEDQGPAFVMHAGDCVLQPPTIRHRVLESSAGLEVIEIGCPAEHQTRRDHDMVLPTSPRRPDRDFDGQRFVRHVAAAATWQASAYPGMESTDTGIDAATGHLASVLLLRGLAVSHGRHRRQATAVTADRPMLVVVLSGRLRLSDAVGAHVLGVDDSAFIPAGADHVLSADAGSEILQVLLPHQVAARGRARAAPSTVT